MGRAELKVPGGKLLRVSTTVREGRIQDIKITGDFFLHPEDSIDDLESRLQGIRAEEDEVSSTVKRFFDSHQITVLGATPKDFAAVVLKSFSSA